MNNPALILLLKNAQSSGETLTIVYHGGSQPGAKRQIEVHNIVDGKYLRALDVTAHKVKQFLLGKIELVDTGDVSPDYIDTRKFDAEYPTTVKAAMAPYLAELENTGLHIDLQENSISLHEYFKNGKPKKTACAGIEYHEYVIEFDWDDDTGEEIEIRKKSKRPWYVYSNTFDNAHTLSHLRKAVELFLKTIKEKGA